MTDAKSANWYSDGENAARRIDDLLPVCDRAPAGDAAEPTLVDGREVFFPIFGGSFLVASQVLFFSIRGRR